MEDDPKNLEVAYIIDHEKNDLVLYVRHTANAWWKRPSKLYRLLLALEDYSSKVEEACEFAEITKKQYKYFARLHPVLSDRIKEAKLQRALDRRAQKRSVLAPLVISGNSRAIKQYLRLIEPDEYDSRYRSPYARLRRSVGLPAQPLVPKNKEENLAEMAQNVEKTRKKFGHPSTEEHYNKCLECRRFRPKHF